MLAAATRLAWLLVLPLVCVAIWLAASSDKLLVRPPKLSLGEISAFLDHYEEKIVGIRSGVYEISLKNFLNNGTFWLEGAVKENNNEVLSPVKQTDPSIWLQAVCIFLSLCLTLTANAGVFYVLCMRYCIILTDAVKLSVKSLKQVDWRTPVHLMRILYWSLRYVVVTLVHLTVSLPPKGRWILLGVLLLLALLYLLRVGMGMERMVYLIPPVITTGIYSCLLKFSSTDVLKIVVTCVGDYIAMMWALIVLIRHYRFTCSPSCKLTMRSDISQCSMKEISFLLDLLLATSLIRHLELIPFVGSLLQRGIYLQHILCFTSMLTIIHFAIFHTEDDPTTGYPLSGLKYMFINSVDKVVHFVVGWPNIIGSRIGKKKRKDSFKPFVRYATTMLSLIPGLDNGDSSPIKGVATVLRWVKMAPYLLLLLFPSFIASLYFHYLTLVSPSMKWVLLPIEAPFTVQTVILFTFVLANMFRYLVGLVNISFLPTKAIAAIALAFTMDTVMRYVEDEGTEGEHAHAE
ncbi:hypothetical protein BgAZ_500920 [Babesia gibsoni]|uniref:Uncharacterized protein n=1 Tax=Babesia gibsoni TaxID=33632 RepID=A0AAD8LQN8_BABGI|nr:hypothetical protein BgAZ_500920 [Babesia gibsoni]